MGAYLNPKHSVTAKLICVFVFAYAKSRFSHDAAHFIFFTLDSRIMSCLFNNTMQEFLSNIFNGQGQRSKLQAQAEQDNPKQIKGFHSDTPSIPHT